ncbi:MAG: iron-sulfur cluster assembly scaffold protein [Alphaproteobacteria bacterium]|nr:iron-sulfur cluster assembly scaffold protein [Alphaproteobacteria bacterium]
MTDQLYHERIVALAKARTGDGRLTAPERTAQRDNPLCGDRISLDLTLDAAGRIAALGHKVRGCLLCQASASVLSAVAVGRDADGVAALRADAEAALAGQGGGAYEAFAPVAAHKSRHECVLLPLQALTDAIVSRQ